MAGHDPTSTPPERRSHALVWTLGILAGLVVAVGAGVVTWIATGVEAVDNALQREPVTEPVPSDTLMPTSAPPVEEGPRTPSASSRTEIGYPLDPNRSSPPPGTRFWMLLGSDSRQGHEFAASQGHADRGRSDVISIIRIAPNSVPQVLSIPRDFRVRYPDGDRDRINAAYAEGGLSKSVHVVTENFGIPIEHIAVVDFAGFERIVDALDGIDVCLDSDLADPMANLEISAGCSHLDGSQALSLVRSRHSEQGGDFARIRRQQLVLVAFARRLGSASALLALDELAESLGSSVTVDEGFQLGQAVGLFRSLSHLADTTRLTTLPGQAAMIDGKSLVVATAESQAVLDAFKTGA